MARKSKVGLDYFPHNCDYDDELKYIIALHKEQGYYVYFEILRRIYSGFGYYMHSNKKVLTLFSNEINVNINDLNVIINGCLSEHLFNKSLHFNHEILTSRGIQERYFEAVKRRNSIDIINEYILIDYANILGDNVNINLLNVNRSTQSKVKESKVKESKEDTILEQVKSTWNFFAKNYGLSEIIKISEERKSKIIARLKNKDFDLVEILKAAESQSFLFGDSKEGWAMDFDWLFANDKNYIKILEKKYKRKNGQNGGSGATIQQLAKIAADWD